MNINTFPLCTLILSIALLFSCNMDKEIEFQGIDNVKFKKLKMNGTAVVSAQAHIFNPKPVAADILGFSGDVKINDKDMGVISQTFKTTMPSNSAFTLPLEFEIPLHRAFDNLPDIFKAATKNMKVNVKMDGNIKIDFAGQEFDIPFEYDEDKALKVD